MQISEERANGGSNMWLIVQGNPIEGFIFTGPFETYNEAQEYGETIRDVDWWSGVLYKPDRRPQKSHKKVTEKP